MAIKLFPGVYQLEAVHETFTVNKPRLDIYGSGQHNTFIEGLYTDNSLVFINSGDSLIKGITSRVNIVCQNASPLIKNCRMIYQGASGSAVIGYVYSHPTLSNCLIAGYPTGIHLENAACSIQSTTIVDCGWNNGEGGIWSDVTVGYTGDINIDIENSIIANCTMGIDIPNHVPITMINTDVFGNSGNFEGISDLLAGGGNFSADPMFVPGRYHNYYLSSISAGQPDDSPCIDAGPDNYNIGYGVAGSTRSDGIFDQCRPDIGYHAPIFSRIVGIVNINNDPYAVDDPKKLLNQPDSNLTAEDKPVMDPSSILSTGPKDLIIITDNLDGTSDFRTYLNQDCFLQHQANQQSPLGVIDAAMSDLDKDGDVDLAVLEADGPAFYLNDSEGEFSFDSDTYKPDSRTIETIDFNHDGQVDILIGSDQGIHVQIADDHLVYSDFQLLNSGDTTDMTLYDFDRDGDSDLVTINAFGEIRFYKNQRYYGFIQVGSPLEVTKNGKLTIKDFDNNGELDVVVEIEPTVKIAVPVGDVFGTQTIEPPAKRSINYALFDHLGTTKLLLDDHGKVSWPRPNEGGLPNEILPFGKDLDFNPENPDPVESSYRLTFTNKEIDHQLDLHYFGARYYNATIPRFISPDPVSGKPAIPISWNRYLYCRNDPINYYDPDGECGIGIAIAAAIMFILDLLEPTSVAAPEDEEAAENYEQNSDFNGIAAFVREENLVFDTYAFLDDPGFCTGLAFVPIAGGVLKKVNIPSKKRIVKILNTTDDSFHKPNGIKDEIKKDFAEELKSINCRNPDVGYNSEGFLVLRHPETKQTIVTDTPISSYAQE